MQDTSWPRQKIFEKLAGLARNGKAEKHGPVIGDLTPRVREVLGLMATGPSDKDIVDKLGGRHNTIRNHVSAISQKMGLHSGSAVVEWARRHSIGVERKPQSKQSRIKELRQ